MPYPPTHLLFYGFAVLIAGVFFMSAISFEDGLRIRERGFLAILLLAGGIASLFPDVPAVWNLLLHGNLRHNMIGAMPSHSLLFGLISVAMAFIPTYLFYRSITKAISIGLMVGAAFVFHLVLDDLEGGNIPYLYPYSDAPLSIFDSHVLATIIHAVRSIFF